MRKWEIVKGGMELDAARVMVACCAEAGIADVIAYRVRVER
jgi:hypothetical protein